MSGWPRTDAHPNIRQVPSLLELGMWTGKIQVGLVTRKPGSPRVVIFRPALVCRERKMKLGTWPEVRMRKRKRILPEFLTIGSQFHSPAFKGKAASLLLGSMKHTQITTTNPLVWLK